MKNTNFKSDYTLDFEMYKEFSKGYNRTKIINKIIPIITIILFILGVIEFLSGEYGFVIMYCLFFIVYGIVIIFLVRNQIRMGFKRMITSNGGVERNNSIIINDKEINIIDINRNNKMNYSFDQVIDVIETKKLLILKLQYNLGIIIDLNKMTGGTKEELVNHLYNNCHNIKNKKVLNGSKKNYFLYLYVILFSTLLITSIAMTIIK